jgi:hypothetical protein
MSGPVILLDFAVPRVRNPLAGLVLLIIGSLAVTATGFGYYSLSARRAGLELKLAAVLRQNRPDPVRDARNARATDEAAGVAAELGLPWTDLLADLERVSHDSRKRIAVLAIEPDQEKHRVRISGESKDLGNALAYLTRLQAANMLKFPMLESHEIVADDKEHPVRFALTADWWPTP